MTSSGRQPRTRQAAKELPEAQGVRSGYPGLCSGVSSELDRGQLASSFHPQTVDFLCSVNITGIKTNK